MDLIKTPGDVREAELIRLMDTYGDMLTGLCTALTRDADLAQDVVQETFLRAYRGFDRYRGGRAQERAWLSRIAVNLCRDMSRSKWFRWVDRRVSLDSLPEPTMPTQERDWRLYDAVQTLPDKLREVVVLHYHQNMDTEEMARVLGTTRTTVYRRLDRAYQLLKEKLEEADDDE